MDAGRPTGSGLAELAGSSVPPGPDARADFSRSLFDRGRSALPGSRRGTANVPGCLCEFSGGAAIHSQNRRHPAPVRRAWTRDWGGGGRPLGGGCSQDPPPRTLSSVPKRTATGACGPPGGRGIPVAPLGAGWSRGSLASHGISAGANLVRGSGLHRQRPGRRFGIYAPRGVRGIPAVFGRSRSAARPRSS